MRASGLRDAARALPCRRPLGWAVFRAGISRFQRQDSRFGFRVKVRCQGSKSRFKVKVPGQGAPGVKVPGQGSGSRCQGAGGECARFKVRVQGRGSRSVSRGRSGSQGRHFKNINTSSKVRCSRRRWQPCCCWKRRPPIRRRLGGGGSGKRHGRKRKPRLWCAGPPQAVGVWPVWQA